MNYNRHDIFKAAWRLFRKLGVSFSEALHRAWLSAKSRPENEDRIRAAKAAAGITEQTETWSGWRELGYMVEHGQHCRFQVTLLHPTRGEGKTIRASFFTFDQVQPLPITV